MTLRLAPLLLLAACAGSPAPPPEFAAALARGGQGSIERTAGDGERYCVPTDHRLLPRAVAVAIRTLQPGGELDALEQVFAGDETWYFARHRFRDPTTPSRSVLLTSDGRVIERSHELAASGIGQDLARAMAAAQAALSAPAVRVEIVHGAPGSEWLRVSNRERSVDCDFAGTVRAVHDREPVTSRR